jgi:phytoene dehydrogenase-like protein
MNKHIVIVGGGLGGLSAGVACAQAGCSVTLFEKQPHTGGYATSFSRGGFIFDPSLHAMPAAGKGDSFDRLAHELGISDNIHFLKIEKGFCARLGPETFQMPAEFAALLDYLSATFPAQRKGLARMHGDIMRLAPVYYNIVEGAFSPYEVITRFIPRAPSFLHHAGISTHDYLSRFISDQRLRALLYHPAVFYGIPMRKFPAINFMIMFYLLLVKGMYTIAGGGHSLSSALDKRFSSLGGRVASCKEIVKIKISGGRAVTAVAADGDETRADAVICNVNTPAMVHKLIGDDFFPPSYVRALNRLGPSLSFLQLHLGLDCPLEATGIASHITTVFPDADLDRILSARATDLSPQGFSIIAPTATDISAAPPDKSVLSMLGAVSSGRWMSLSKSEYDEAKKRCTDELLAKLEEISPAARQNLAVVDCATPRTFQRYTANPGGAILGFDCSLGHHRTIMKISRVPIKNLFCASAWTDRLGGFLQVIKAGVTAAKNCMKEINLK